MDSDKKILCTYCSKSFTNFTALKRHQKNVKSCLKLQGKEELCVKCPNCHKKFTEEYYKRHKDKCEDLKRNREDIENKDKLNKKLRKQFDKREKEYKLQLEKTEKIIEKMKMDIIEYKTNISNLKETINYLKKQNENITVKLAEKVSNVTMKIEDKASTINNHKTVIINSPLTNDVLRKCAETFTIDNAYNINGITKHLTSSLEDHVKCTDPSRNIFKYTNEKDEEIIDPDLENLIPQYLTAIKDRNNFLYKEVF